MGDIHFQLQIKVKAQNGQTDVVQDIHSTKHMGSKNFNKCLSNKDVQHRLLNKVISEKEDELTKQNNVFEIKDLNSRELVDLKRNERKRRIDLRLPAFFNQNKIKVTRVSRIPVRSENSLAKKALSDVTQQDSLSSLESLHKDECKSHEQSKAPIYRPSRIPARVRSLRKAMARKSLSDLGKVGSTKSFPMIHEQAAHKPGLPPQVPARNPARVKLPPLQTIDDLPDMVPKPPSRPKPLKVRKRIL